MNDKKPPPAETVAENEDLLTKILLNLPPRSLVRFKSVCRAWRLVISSRHFSRRHSQSHHHQKLNGLLLHFLNRPYLELSPIDPDLPTTILRPRGGVLDSPTSDLTVLQSCNGLLLLLLAASSSTDSNSNSNRSYCVYNPTTSLCAAIPPLGGGAPDLWASLAFKYPSPENQYRVVHVRASSSVSSNRFEIQTYDSTIGHWIQAVEEFAAPFGMSFCNGVYWNGSIHWLGPNGDGLRFGVDTDGRVEKIPPLPDNRPLLSSGARRQRVVQESGGRLFLIEINGKSNPQFEVLEMARDYSGWDVRYRVDIGGIIGAYPEMVKMIPASDAVVLGCQSHYYAFRVCFLVADEDGDLLLVLRIPGKLIGYSLKEKKCLVIRKVVPSSATASRFEWVDVFPFLETLTWV